MIALSVATAVVALAACGGSPSTNTASKSSPTPIHSAAANLSVGDVCKLVTAGEASAAVGTTVANAAGSSQIPGACFYTSSDGSSGVIIYAIAEADATAAQSVDPSQIEAGFASMYGIKNAHEVNGIGDKAFEYTVTSTQSNQSGVAIFVFKANVLLFLIMTPSTDSSKIESLAKTAVSRLS